MTITHQFDREEVMAYLDGELAPSRALEVHAHLETCAECSAIAKDLRDVSLNLGAWTIEPAPGALVAPAGAPVKPAARRLWWPRGLSRLIAPRWIAIGAASAAVLAAVVVVQPLLRGPAAIPPPAAAVTAGGGDVSDALRSLGYARAPRPTVMPESRLGRGGAQGQQGQSSKPGANAQWNLEGGAVAAVPPPPQPQAGGADAQMIARTATVSLQTDKFDDTRAGLERVATAHHGSMSGLDIQGDPPNRRSLNATMRVPVAEMDAALAGVRGLGHVLQESQSSEDVTDAHRDLAIRIANAKVEEARLGEILKDRTGKLSDVLAVEQAQSRVRTQIEQMEGEELAMRNRAALSTITINVSERYQAALDDAGPTPVGVRLRNALVDGARAAIDSAVGVTLAILSAAPTLALWTALLFFPVRAAWRWLRRRSVIAG